MLLSVIIPVYGQMHLLLNCVDSLLRTATSPIDLILIDDAYPAYDLTKVKFPYPCRIARLDKNGGFSQACNAGAKAAQGDILFFLNSDTEAHPNWQQPLLDVFNEERVGIVGPRLLYPANYWCPICHVYQMTLVEQDGKMLCMQCGGVCESVETIQSCGGWFDANYGPFHRWLGWRADDPRVNVKEDVSWLTGAAMAVRKDVFMAMEGFDPIYGRGYFEDVDASMKVKHAGLRCVYEPKVTFTHIAGQSTAGYITETDFRKNALTFINRWQGEIVRDVLSTIYVKYW